MYASSKGRIMLVLSRKVGERILVGDEIRITVVRLTNGGVRLGIEAPADMSVLREEVKRQDVKRQDVKGEGGTVPAGAQCTERSVSGRRPPR
jgi:carbon storage regulator